MHRLKHIKTPQTSRASNTLIFSAPTQILGNLLRFIISSSCFYFSKTCHKKIQHIVWHIPKQYTVQYNKIQNTITIIFQTAKSWSWLQTLRSQEPHSLLHANEGVSVRTFFARHRHTHTLTYISQTKFYQSKGKSRSCISKGAWQVFFSSFAWCAAAAFATVAREKRFFQRRSHISGDVWVREGVRRQEKASGGHAIYACVAAARGCCSPNLGLRMSCETRAQLANQTIFPHRPRHSLFKWRTRVVVSFGIWRTHVVLHQLVDPWSLRLQICLKFRFWNVNLIAFYYVVLAKLLCK